MTPFVSVLIPCYNGVKFLAPCIESALAQSFNDIEIIVVDDASTDSTYEVASRYARQDRRVSVVRNPHNLGLVANWNKCVQLAKGEWIKFLFQDDLIAPDNLQRLLDATRETKRPIVFCRRGFQFEEGVPPERQRFYLSRSSLVQHHFVEGDTPPERVCELILDVPETNFIGEPVAVLYHRNLHERFGPFNPNLIVSCDKEYWFRLGVNTGIAHVAQELATFRVHGSSTTSISFDRRLFRMNVLDEVLILHDYAFSPLYDPLRRVSRARGIDLKARFIKKAAWAFNLATRSQSRSSSEHARARADWEATAAVFPRLREVEWHTRGGRLARSVRALGRRLLAR